MANPIIGALFFGLFSGTPGTGVPVNSLTATEMPTPVCVECSAHQRRAPTVFDWSNGRAGARYERLLERRVLAAGDELMSAELLGLGEQQLQRYVDYSGA